MTETKVIFNPRQQAKLILSWAQTHIEDKPCGRSRLERAHMRRVHADTVRVALEGPGVKEALTKPEKARLLGILGSVR